MFADVQMINVLLNIFRVGEDVRMRGGSGPYPGYVCSLDEQGDEFQVFYDPGLDTASDSDSEKEKGGRERSFDLFIQGLNNYSLRL